MGPVFIVVVHEVLVGVAALGVVVPVAGVGPFLVEGAVETFDFAVGLGPVGPGAPGAGAGVFERGEEVFGAVAGAVVGEHSLAGDPREGIEGGGSPPEPRRGEAGLVGVDL